MHFESVVSKYPDIVKKFAIAIISGTSDCQEHVLVLKTNGEMFNLDPHGKDVFQKSTEINLNDGIHVAWQLFGSAHDMETFINVHRLVGKGVAKSPMGSEVKIGSAA